MTTEDSERIARLTLTNRERETTHRLSVRLYGHGGVVTLSGDWGDRRVRVSDDAMADFLEALGEAERLPESVERPHWLPRSPLLVSLMVRDLSGAVKTLGAASPRLPWNPRLCTMSALLVGLIADSPAAADLTPSPAELAALWRTPEEVPAKWREGIGEVFPSDIPRW